MQNPATARMFISQRALLLGWLMAYMTCAGGCSTLVNHTYRKMFDHRVCPTCNAKRIDNCHCFTASDHVGYQETNWISLSDVEAPASRIPPVPAARLPIQVRAKSDLPNSQTNFQLSTRSAISIATPLEISPLAQENFAQSTGAPVVPARDGVYTAAFEERARPITVHISAASNVPSSLSEPDNDYDYYKP